MPDHELSIYEYIAGAVVEGALPDDFNLDEFEQERGQIRMADGAWDGIAIYHMASPDLPGDIDERIGNVVDLASAGAYERADEACSSLVDEFRAIAIIDQVEGYVHAHAREIDAEALFHYAMRTLLLSRDVELLKIGFELLEVFGEPDDEVKDVARLLGLSDEFAIFAVFNMMDWHDGNQEVFELAKKVRGWGRIHAIAKLEPETAEIRDWLFFEGVDNEVVPAYSALECYEKSGFASRMKQPLNAREFTAAGTIVDTLLDEGPVPGISALDDSQGALQAYIGHAAQHDLDLDDLYTVFHIRAYADHEGFGKTAQDCDGLLGLPASRAKVEEAVARGEAISLADYLGIPYCEALLAAMQADFDGQYTRIGWLLDDDSYVDRALDLVREKVPLDSMEEGPRDEIGFGFDYDLNIKLDFVLQSLREHLLAGEDIVSKALMSPTVRNRAMAHRVLKSWVYTVGIPLGDLSSELYERLKAAYEAEPRDDLKQSMRPLLDGTVNYRAEEM